MTRQREQDLVTLCCGDAKASDEAATLSLAQDVWRMLYGNARAKRTVQRIDAGRRRPRPAKLDGQQTHAEFIKRRRQDVRCAASTSSTAILSAGDMQRLTASHWTPAMQKEELHMKTKRATRLMDNVKSGVPVPARLLGGLTEDAITEVYTANLERLKRARAAGEVVKSRAFRPRPEVDLHGVTVFWEPSALVQTDVAQQLIHAMRLRTVDHPRDATFVVLSSLDDLGQLTRWRLVLGGGKLANCDFMRSAGREGACLHFKPAIETPRAIWTSASWTEKHPTLWTILDDAMRLPTGKWTWFVGNNAEFVRRSLRVTKLFGVVTTVEKAVT
ncbi:MAG: hypothetical protein GY772_08175 [bacterium]|nr:hypothetical protein [bacterium]